MINFQSSETDPYPGPSGTFENSPAIHGWVHGPQTTQSPEGTTEIILGLFGLKCKIRVHWRPSVVKNPFLQNEPNFLPGLIHQQSTHLKFFKGF
jgi:hypothetical protein